MIPQSHIMRLLARTHTAPGQRQYGWNYSPTGLGATVTLASGPLVGNLLVAMAVICDPYEPATVGLPTGFTTLASYFVSTYFRNGGIVGTRIVQAGDGASWTFTSTASGTGRYTTFYVFEFTGLPAVAASVGPATVINGGSNPSQLETGPTSMYGPQVVIATEVGWAMAGWGANPWSPTSGMSAIASAAYPTDCSISAEGTYTGGFMGTVTTNVLGPVDSSEVFVYVLITVQG